MRAARHFRGVGLGGPGGIGGNGFGGSGSGPGNGGSGPGLGGMAMRLSPHDAKHARRSGGSGDRSAISAIKGDAG